MHLYSSLLLPYLNYCVDTDKHPTNTNNIVLLQKRVIRIVFRAGRLNRTNSLCQQHVPTFPDIIQLTIVLFTITYSMFTYKTEHSLLNASQS